MCFDGCGNTIQSFLKTCLEECIDKKMIPADARLIVDAEPRGLGLHELTLSIESDSVDFILTDDGRSMLSAQMRENIVFDVIDEQEDCDHQPGKKKNWINLLINLLSMGSVLVLSLIFPPSIFLTVGLTLLTCVSTLFTSRQYLFDFFQNFRTRNFANMGTTISLGWFLSMAHTLFHAISMPLVSSFSMMFMNFIMPTILIACINGMDEIKRIILEKSKKIQVKGIKALFPQMSETYRCYQLPESELEQLSHAIELIKESSGSLDTALPLNQEEEARVQRYLESQEGVDKKRNLLREGLIIDVNPSECFPVDCVLIKGNTIIDASLLTGEPYQEKHLWQFTPAGAINLGQKVSVYAVKNAYNSTVNALLFRSNRAKPSSISKEKVPTFAYLYTALVLIGLLAAIITPLALGIATIPLLMQNMIGILFSVCPCTIAIAHQLPQLISLHHRSTKGIQLRDDGLTTPETNDIHTVIFDKTGTLTTGHSVVESSSISLSSSLWQRIYLLEKRHGREHPLAQAIHKHYESSISDDILFDEITDVTRDSKHRGLSANVQGKSIHLGSFDYLKDSGITLPEPEPLKMQQGFSAVCVAEEGVYKGIIYVKHEIRPGALQVLTQLKKEGKKIILLTGDNDVSARGFNQQMSSVFAEEDIHAGQTPQDKEAFLEKILSAKGVHAKGVWFVGDGLNDAPCCRILSEKGGVSCAIESNNKSAFFTDITLNGSLDYLTQHHKLNQSLQQHITQNKGILIYSTIAFLAFIIGFSIAGIAVSPLISMAMMVATTLFVLFNSFRTQMSIDIALDKKSTWLRKLLSSNFSIGVLLSASTLLIGATMIATIATGGLALPVIAFTGGVALALSSLLTLSAIALLAMFTALLSASLLSDRWPKKHIEPSLKHTSLREQESILKDTDTITQAHHRDVIFSPPKDPPQKETPAPNMSAFCTQPLSKCQ